MYPWGHISILALILEGLKSPMKHKLNRQTNFWDKKPQRYFSCFLYCHHVPGTLSLMELAVPLSTVTVGFCGSCGLSNFLSSTSWLSCTNPGVSLGFIQKNRTHPSHLKRWDSAQIGSLFTAAEGKYQTLTGGETVLIIVLFSILEGPRRMAGFVTRSWRSDLLARNVFFFLKYLNITIPCWPDDGRVTAETCSQM